MNKHELKAMIKKQKEALLTDDAANMGMVSAAIGLIILLAVLYIGLLVVDGMYGATALTTGSVFYATSQDLVNTTASSYAMAGVMPIVSIAVALLSALLMMLYAFSRR